VDAADGGTALRSAAADAASFDWIVLTSVNGVDRFWAALEAAAGPDPSLEGVRFACVGPRTAAALARRGPEPAVVAERHVAEGLLEALPLAEMGGHRVLLPQAAGARTILAERLKEAGAQVTEVEAYRAAGDARGAAGVRERLERGEIDVLTFTSSSTVEQFVEAVGAGADTHGALVAAIGPITAQTARDLGLVVDVVAHEQTVPGLIAALVEHKTTRAETEQP
jgi:uroporphyrinogen-III synthase